MPPLKPKEASHHPKTALHGLGLLAGLLAHLFGPRSIWINLFFASARKPIHPATDTFAHRKIENHSDKPVQAEPFCGFDLLKHLILIAFIQQLIIIQIVHIRGLNPGNHPPDGTVIEQPGGPKLFQARQVTRCF